jgi:hypothetical protein
MTNGEAQASGARQLQAWRLALHAAETEKAGLIARLDERIAGLRQAIETLDQQLAAEGQPARSEDATPSERPPGVAASADAGGTRSDSRLRAKRQRKGKRSR